MFDLILGNIFSFLSASCIAISVIKRNKSDLVWWQIIDIIFCLFSNIFLLAYAALITNLIALLRNILSYKNKLNLKLTILLTILCIAVGCFVNNRGIFGILAIVASASYTVFMYSTQNDQQMRYALVFNLTLWFMHDLYIQAYPSSILEILLVFWTLVQILKNQRLHRKDIFYK